jgi:hypothetical protein
MARYRHYLLDPGLHPRERHPAFPFHTLGIGCPLCFMVHFRHIRCYVAVPQLGRAVLGLEKDITCARQLDDHRPYVVREWCRSMGFYPAVDRGVQRPTCSGKWLVHLCG